MLLNAKNNNKYNIENEWGKVVKSSEFMSANFHDNTEPYFSYSNCLELHILM